VNPQTRRSALRGSWGGGDVLSSQCRSQLRRACKSVSALWCGASRAGFNRGFQLHSYGFRLELGPVRVAVPDMKTPPFLLAAALLFWGWQTGFLLAGIVMAVVLESARFIKGRWELSDDDFARIWTFCALLFLAAFVFAFANNGGPASFGKLAERPNFNAERVAGNVSALTAISLIRWLPMIFFLFMAAQAFGPRPGVPLETISLILWRRRKKARKAGRPVLPTRNVNISYPYFVTCLFAASGHGAENDTFFWGLAVLVAWALWPQRSRRYDWLVWLAVLGAAVVLGFLGQRGIGRAARLLEEYNPQWLARFMPERTDPRETHTQIGHIGRMKLSGKIVIRLEPEGGAVPTYLREATYRRYESEIWHAGSSHNDFSGISETPPNSENWPLLPGKTNAATVNIACYLNGINRQSRNAEGLLPLPLDSGSLENLPAYILQKNSAGAVLAEGPGLVIFDAHYGSGATIDSLPDTNEDLEVPQKERTALDRVIADGHLAGLDEAQTIQAVGEFFARNFTYSLWQDTPNISAARETPLGCFLLHTRSGHCEYFATATVLLLRELHIPARYAVGYAVHEKSGKHYVVRSRDAHAWCLVWNSQTKAWQTLDTTPGSWVAEEEAQASPLQFLSDGWSWFQFQVAKFRWGESQLQRYVLWVLIPVLCLLLGLILFRSRLRHRRKAVGAEDLSHWPGLDSEFYRLEKKLTERGVTRLPGEPLSVWLQRAVGEPGLADLRQPLEALLFLHYRHRFDPQGLSAPERETLRKETAACLTTVTRRD